jgi:hypothetical protein
VITNRPRHEIPDTPEVSRRLGRHPLRLAHRTEVPAQQSIKCDIDAEVRRLQMAMDVLWPRVMQGELKAVEVWRKLGVDLRILTGWQAPASSGFHLSVNVAKVTTGSAKLEELLNNLAALPAPASAEAGNEAGKPRTAEKLSVEPSC